MKHIILLFLMNYACSFTLGQLQGHTKNQFSSKIDKNTPARYKLDTLTDPAFFPEVEYPTSVLDKTPFYYNSNNAILDPFVRDEEKSTFKSIVTEETKLSAPTRQMVDYDPTSVEKEIKSPTEGIEELEAARITNECNDNDIVAKDTASKENSIPNSDSEETMSDLHTLFISEIERSSENSSETIQPNENESSDSLNTILVTTTEQYENQIPIPILLTDTEQLDEIEIPSNIEDIALNVDRRIDNGILTYYEDIFSSPLKTAQAISTSDYILSKIQSNYDSIVNELGNQKSITPDPVLNETEEFPFFPPINESY